MKRDKEIKTEFNTEVKRVNGYLKEIVTFFDSSGNPSSQTINPLMTELKPRDIMQIFVGAFLVATPLAFTEEVWKLSIELKIANVFALGTVSIVVSALFIYFNFYRFRFKGNVIQYCKRVLLTYLIAASSIILILALIDKFPVINNPLIAVKRVIIIGFPTIFAATISDFLK